MIRDPREELRASARACGSAEGPHEVEPTVLAAVRLARRRFGVALPLPFVLPPDPDSVPLRRIEPGDLGAIEVLIARAAATTGDVSGSVDALLGPGWRAVVAGSRGEAFGFVAVRSRADRRGGLASGAPSGGEDSQRWGPVVDPSLAESVLAHRLALAAEEIE